MKCIQCQTDNTLKDRTEHSGCCKSCRHRFAFEPTTMQSVKVTDPMFKRTIEDLSVNNTLFFTNAQLAYFLDGRLRRSRYTKAGWIALFLLYAFFNLWFTGFFGGISTALLRPIVATAVGVKLPGLFFFVAANFVLQGLCVWHLFRRATSRKVDSKERRLSARLMQAIGVIVLVAGIPASLFIAPSFILFVVAVCLGMWALYRGNRQSAQPLVEQEFLFEGIEFQRWLNRWQEVNGEVVKLLPPPREQMTAATINPDVTAYSFDRLVVCESADVAQMLIANNFHFENNCAILSITGYPQSIFDTTMQMLRRNPDLKVYALHNCSPRGVGLIHRLQTSDRWFQSNPVVMVDVGLSPRQVMAARSLFVQNSAESAQAAQQLPQAVRASLSTAERQWLEAGNYVELESFTPQRLIQVLNRGIAGSRDLEEGNDSFLLVGDSGSYLYASESFG